MPVYVLTGSNRGIGLEFVRQLSTSKTSHHIFAGVRSVSNDHSELQSLASDESSSCTIKVLECDTSSSVSMKEFAHSVISALGGKKINVLINNAGINAVPEQTSLTMQPKDLQDHITVNVLGPATLTSLLSSHLDKGAVVANLTSGLGSCGKGVVKCTTYSISKAGLNMLTVHQAADLAESGVRVICVDPGWVQTRMGGAGAIITAQESVHGLWKVIGNVRDG